MASCSWLVLFLVAPLRGFLRIEGLLLEVHQTDSSVLAHEDVVPVLLTLTLAERVVGVSNFKGLQIVQTVSFRLLVA